MEKASVFKETYQNYLDQIGQINLDSIAEKLGGRVEKDEMVLSFFGQPFRST